MNNFFAYRRLAAVAAALMLSGSSAFAADISSAAEFIDAMTTQPLGSHTLKADIDLTGSGFATITEFNGTLDGAGHTISGTGAKPLIATLGGTIKRLTLDGTANDKVTTITSKNIGALCNTAVGAVFEDVVVKGYEIKQSASASNSNGLFAGISYGATFVRCATGSDCTVTGNGMANTTNGGFLGKAGYAHDGQIFASFTDCTNNAAIIEYTVTSGYTSNCGGGGFVGDASASGANVPKMIFNRCVNNGSISMPGKGSSGGLVGRLIGTASNNKGLSNRAIFLDCINNGEITASCGDYIGGMLGRGLTCSSAIFERCVNYGTINCTGSGNVAGGLVGYFGDYMSDIAGANDLTVRNCANYGSVTAPKAAGLANALNTNTGWGSGVYRLENSVNYGVVTGSTYGYEIAGSFGCGHGGCGADNCFGLTAAAGPQISSGTFTTENYVSAADEGYTAADAVAALNEVAATNDNYLAWLVGPSGYPELCCFTNRTAADYTVAFVDWDGNYLTNETVAAGGAAVAPESPERTGYTFTGWDKSFAAVNSDLIVSAVYDDKVTVTVDLADGSEPTEFLRSIGTRCVLGDPERAGYDFVGWQVDTSYAVASTLASDIVKPAGLTLTALWLEKKEPFVSKLTFLQWDMKSMDSTSRDARGEALNAVLVANDVDIAALCGFSASTTHLDPCMAKCPGYSYAFTTSNGSSDANARLFVWKTSRFEQFAAAAKVMPTSNATVGWTALRDLHKGTIFVPVAGFYYTTKGINEFVNNATSSMTALKDKFPSATILFGLDLANANGTTALTENYTDYAGLGSAIESAWEIDSISATDDFQYTFLYRPWTDYADNMVTNTVKVEDASNQVNPGYVTTFRFGPPPGLRIFIR